MVIIQDVTLEWERASTVVSQRNTPEGLKTVLFQKRDDVDENPSREGRILHTGFFKKLLREISNCIQPKLVLDY